jgi:uncharacterized membrane protein YphA (DoxX/SURF4 family)
MTARNIAAKWRNLAPQLRSVFRIAAAFMFILAGSMKIFAFPAGVPPNGGTVPLISEVGLAGILEVFGGALLLIGLFTRPVAFLLSGEMAVAYFQFHYPQGFWPIMNGGVSAVLYCFIWLYFSAAGAGPLSLDARMMDEKSLRRFAKVIRNLPNLFQGYNIYVNRDKLRLIDYTLSTIIPQAKSFADLGGVWKVNGAYSIHALKQPRIERGILVDTDFPGDLEKRLRTHQQLQLIQGDFALRQCAEAVGKVDVVFFFDVLLHQANPHWDEVLALYSTLSPCLVIYNQQFIQSEGAIRLTDLPLNKYVELVPDIRLDTYRYVFEHKTEMHPKYGKPWGDIHNIFQWGITDKALRATMMNLGFDEVYYKNHGRFLELPAFENHAFIFRSR